MLAALARKVLSTKTRKREKNSTLYKDSFSDASRLKNGYRNINFPVDFCKKQHHYSRVASPKSSSLPFGSAAPPEADGWIALFC
jgi:hypothetical protein